MVTPNPDKSAWWIKDDYSREEIDQLVQWGLDHFWTQNHQMADLVAASGSRTGSGRRAPGSATSGSPCTPAAAGTTTAATRSRSSSAHGGQPIKRKQHVDQSPPTRVDRDTRETPRSRERNLSDGRHRVDHHHAGEIEQQMNQRDNDAGVRVDPGRRHRGQQRSDGCPDVSTEKRRRLRRASGPT